jgi:hypothetical protein
LSCRIFLRIQNYFPPGGFNTQGHCQIFPTVKSLPVPFSGEGAKEDCQLFKGSEHHDAQKEERAGKVPAPK